MMGAIAPNSSYLYVKLGLPCPPVPTPTPKPELLAPAGNWDCARAAVANGADAASGLGEPVRARPRERAAALDPLAKGR